MTARRPSTCLTLTSPFVLSAFLLGHIRRLLGFSDITVCVNRGESDIPIVLPAGARLHPVEIRREMSPLHDLAAVFQLWLLYRRERFDAVVSVTPKGGLLGMLAARLAGVPVRVHWFTGQVWATRRGIGRTILKLVDRLLAGCATRVLADSPTQRDFLVAEGVVAASRIDVLGEGSICGVDAVRFRPDPESRSRIRKALNIPEGSPCLLYVGRMKRDKGIPELLEAFRQLRGEFPNLQLLLVGPDEELLLQGPAEPGHHVIGYAKDVESFMAAADIFCLPSHREGFGSVLIEAAAVGLPSVASKIYGITDAVVDGRTGLLHTAGNAGELAGAARELLLNPDLRERMAAAGRCRAVESFAASQVEGLFAAWLQAALEKARDGNRRG